MKRNGYEVEKNVEKVLRGGATGFLNGSVRMEVQSKLKKKNFLVYAPFEEAEKVILYSGSCPKVRLFRVSCYKDDELRHSAIMGSLFGLNITSEMFGDIIKWNDNFYVYLLDEISDLVAGELNMVGNVPVTLKEVDSDLLENFQREYEKCELIVSSLRIDTVISRLVGCSRDSVNEKVKNQEVYVNDMLVRKASGILNIGDVFSIRKYGKFKFRDVIGRTKKDNFIIEIDRYI